jgi:hypothetical protein
MRREVLRQYQAEKGWQKETSGSRVEMREIAPRQDACPISVEPIEYVYLTGVTEVTQRQQRFAICPITKRLPRVPPKSGVTPLIHPDFIQLDLLVYELTGHKPYTDVVKQRA